LVYLLSSPAPSFSRGHIAQRVAGCRPGGGGIAGDSHFEHRAPTSAGPCHQSDDGCEATFHLRRRPFSSCWRGPAVAPPRSDIVNETLKTPRNCA
jgi:hypothetical protein